MNWYQRAVKAASGDSEYLDAVARGDAAAAQGIVVAAARNAGYAVGPVAHGTDEDFNTFERTEDIGFHFGPAETASKRVEQAEMGGHARTVRAFLAIRNPLRMPDLFTWKPSAVLDELVRAGVVTSDEADSMDMVGREEVARALSSKGYDGVVYRNETEGGGDSYIAMEPWQVKSADAVTRDDSGEIVPVSQRFNTSNQDIRY